MGATCATLCTCEKIMSCIGSCWSIAKKAAAEDAEKKNVESVNLHIENNIECSHDQANDSRPAMESKEQPHYVERLPTAPKLSLLPVPSREPGGKGSKSEFSIMDDVRQVALATKYYTLIESNPRFGDLIVGQTRGLKSSKYIIGAIDVITTHGLKSIAQQMLATACEIDFRSLLDIYDVLMKQ